MKEEIKHWADQQAENIIREMGKKKRYTCAAGISPSGTVHFGNFREIITVDLVYKALKEKLKNVRFIYSWDDYDRLRKIPLNVKKEWEKYIGMPISEIPDPFGCHKNYALHFEKELENSLHHLTVNPEFIRQNEKYKKCEYAKEIKTALLNRKKIIEILNNYRKEPLEEEWFPLIVYCEKCKKDNTKIINYDEDFTITYECECGYKNTIDFRKKGVVKLPWRIDWPMRWYYEDVDFEPGGKEHSTPGGSRTTAKEIVKAVWNKKAPVYMKYDFIILKEGGKMSSSLGNIFSLADVLSIYEPSIVRYMFVSTRPDAEFFVSFDLDVLKVYEDFDKCERIYFNKKEAKDEKEYLKQKRIYELSATKIPKKQPIQPIFRHLVNLIQIYENDFSKIKEYYKKQIKTDFDKERLKQRTERAKNWLEKHAPDDYKFTVQKEVKIKLNDKEKQALLLVVKELDKKHDEKNLHEAFYNISKKIGLEPKDFFKAAYKVLINKERGPRLASFILTIGKDRVIELLAKL